MVSILYPGMPQGPDISGFTDGLAGLGQRLQQRRYEKEAPGLLEQLYGPQAQQQPMSLASLGQQGGQIERQPLASPTDPASQRVAQAHAASGGTPPQGAIEAYIRHAAKQRGIDPEIAVRVAMSEGGVSDPTRQSDVVKNGVREQSYGPFQLYMGGGLGNEFQQATGLHPSDPGAWQKGIDFALDKAKEGGWGPWYGAAKAGIGNRDGIGGAQGALNAMAAPQGQQMPQSTPQGQGGFNVDPALMKQLFANPLTRDLAIDVARTRLAAMQDQNDPMKRLAFEKAQLEVEKLRTEGTKPNIVNAGDGQLYDANSGQWIEGPGRQNGQQGGFRFDGKSVEAQALNGLMDSGQITAQQAQQLGAGKTITGPNGEIIFLTPQGVFGQPAGGGQPQPLGGQPAGNIPITEPKVTVDEKKAMTFADRMYTSGKIIDDMGTAGSGKLDQIASQVPGVGEYLTSDDFKKVDQAKRDFINAQLRRESGAVIAESEFDNANKQYFPQPNDTPEVLEQKKRNRQIVIDGMARDSGPTYKAPALTGQISSQADYDALPSGAEFTAPDGSRRRKP